MSERSGQTQAAAAWIFPAWPISPCQQGSQQGIVWHGQQLMEYHDGAADMPLTFHGQNRAELLRLPQIRKPGRPSGSL